MLHEEERGSRGGGVLDPAEKDGEGTTGCGEGARKGWRFNMTLGARTRTHGGTHAEGAATVGVATMVVRACRGMGHGHQGADRSGRRGRKCLLPLGGLDWRSH